MWDSKKRPFLSWNCRVILLDHVFATMIAAWCLLTVNWKMIWKAMNVCAQLFFLGKMSGVWTERTLRRNVWKGVRSDSWEFFIWILASMISFVQGHWRKKSSEKKTIPYHNCTKLKWNKCVNPLKCMKNVYSYVKAKKVVRQNESFGNSEFRFHNWE